MTQDLKPCPFCGSTDFLITVKVGSLMKGMPGHPTQIRCRHLDCEDVQGPVAYGKWDAIAAWNRRAKPDAAQ